MREDDLSYFRYRAEVETVLAQKADKPAVVAAHFQLADLYCERAKAETAGGLKLVSSE